MPLKISDRERKEAACRLAQEIRAWNQIAKIAHTSASCTQAYAVKCQKLSIALLHYGDFFRVSSVEFDTPQGTRVLVRFPIRNASAHAPLTSLGEEVQEFIRQNILNKI